MNFYYYPVLAGRRSSPTPHGRPLPSRVVVSLSCSVESLSLHLECTREPKVLGNDGCVFAQHPRPDDVNMYKRCYSFSHRGLKRSLRLARN